MTHAISKAGHGRQLGLPGGRGLHRVLRAAVRWHRRRRCTILLRDLPDHVLRDIGVAPGEIESAVRRQYP
ncbi:MAG: DUF1127 domain-containing protein [Pseudomonadota bacterium]